MILPTEWVCVWYNKIFYVARGKEIFMRQFSCWKDEKIMVKCVNDTQVKCENKL